MWELRAIQIRRIVVALFLACLTPGALGAQEATETVAASQVIEEQQAALNRVSARAAAAERQLATSPEDDGVLADLGMGVREMLRLVTESGTALRARLERIGARLEEIGPAPGAEEAAEPESLARERLALQSERAGINALTGEAEALSQRLNLLLQSVSHARRTLFNDNLLRRYDLGRAISATTLADFAVENRRLHRSVSSWLRFVAASRPIETLLASLLALGAALVVYVGGRRLLGDLLVPDPAQPDPSYLSRVSVAFWRTLLPSAALVVFFQLGHALLSHLGVLRVDIARLMSALFAVIPMVFFVCRLAVSVFSPGLPNWRLLPVTTPAARVLVWLVGLMAVIAGLNSFLSGVSEAMASPLALTVAKGFFATVLIGVLVVIFGLVKPFAAADGTARGWHPALRFTLYALGCGTILAALLGHIGLARFISQQIVVAGAVLTMMHIGFLSAGAVAEEGVFPETALGRRLDRRFGLTETAGSQLGLLAGFALRLLVLAVGVPLILMQWGFRLEDMRVWAYTAATEIRIGSITISIAGILTGAALFFIGYFGTRAFQRWLDGRVMARGRVDAGMRNSISTVIGYAGVALAALIGVSAAGIDLSSFALLAGALSVGVGFGLQNIVNNFVSGLILLLDRPFKVGDWIVAGAVEGTVRKINVRATEIETFQRQTVILPNSELINSGLRNWTHHNRLGGLDIPVAVAAGQGMRRIEAKLMEIARGQAGVLKNPPPSVTVTDFSAASVKFTLRVFVPDVHAQGTVANEIRYDIIEAFAHEGITLA